MSRQLSVFDARDRFPLLVRTLREGDPVEIIHGGEAVAVLITASDYQRLAGPEGEDWSQYSALCARNQLDELDLQVV